MLAPIVNTIEVPCGQAMAFRVFLEEMGGWWPLGRFTTSAMAGAVAKTVRVDARLGGEIWEVAGDGNEYLWGRIRSYEPYDFVAMDFHIPHADEEVLDRSLVEVRFLVVGEARTRVEVTQSNWEAFGDRAADMQGGYGSGWAVILEGYLALVTRQDVGPGGD